MKHILIHTDGSCLGNPGRGGWAALLSCGEENTRALSGGYALTTNNRMEIMAAVAALEALEEPCEVKLVTDSQYLRHAVEKNWLGGWIRNGWITAAKKPVKNQDLWKRLQRQLKRHRVRFSWVKGHAGHAENELCDKLAREQAERTDTPEDKGFTAERGL